MSETTIIQINTYNKMNKCLVILFIILSKICYSQQDSILIKGIVIIKENNETVPFALVNISNYEFGAYTNLDGKFQFNIPVSLLKNKLTIQTKYVGYIFDTLILKKNRSNELVIYGYNNSIGSWSGEITQFQEPIIYGDHYGATVTSDEYQRMTVMDYLRKLKNDTICEKEFISDPCNNNEQIKWKYFETGNLKHNKKTGDWIAYWNNGNLCYKAKYRQKLKLKKIPISKFVKDKKYPYGKYITSEKLKLRYWMIPIDTLIEYNLNGVLSKTVYFSKSGKILNDVINIYDDQGRLRLVRNLINNKSLEYCPHGFTSDQAQDSSAEDKRVKHSETCKWECYFDYSICPLEPVEGSNVVRAKF